jgi:outer membrane protein OmpA-like peptidoglycan-associated protein
MRTLISSSLLAGLLLVGCASAPKPPELDTLEKLRAQANMPAAQKRSPELMRDSEDLFHKSRKEWQDKDLEESRRDALMSSIKLKTAVALADQDAAKASIARADGEQKKVEADWAQVNKELQAMNEQIALYKKLGAAQASIANEKAKLGVEQERAAARDKLAAAELAIKTADLVNAATYSKDLYATARDNLERAQNEAKQNNFAAAQISADMAKQKAEEAAKAARPEYESSEQHKTDKARDEALARDASAIPSITVKLERRGDVQRLVLPMRGLFAKRSTALSGGEAALDAVGALLKKYPTYAVQVIGHTDSKGKHGELLALSLARAQSVFSALVARGVDPKRLMVSGQGPDEPVGENKSAAGREQNNRVEVVFLY